MQGSSLPLKGVIIAFNYKNETCEFDISKVDQLTAMHWCNAAWNNILVDIISNCFKRIGLLDIALIDQEVEFEEASIKDELLAIEQLNICNPMSIEALLNPVEEENCPSTIHR